MKKLAVVATTFLALAPQIAQSEAYIGGKLGGSWLDGSCSEHGSCSDESFAGGIYGGYNFTKMFALEAGYDVLGALEVPVGASKFDDEMRAITLAPKLTVPVGDFDLFGKVGAAWVDYDDIDDSVLLTAIGAEYGFSENVSGRLEYQRINNITEGVLDNLDVNSIFLGLTYKFGASEAAPVPAPVVMEEPAPEPEPVVEPVVKAEPKLFQEYGVELFDTDSAKLAPNSEQYFDWIVGVMNKYPQANVQIVGHTDSRGSESYNQALSEKRAQSVANYLTSQGIEESRITVRGEGESTPKATNDTAEGRMANRRVEVIIDEFEITE